MYSSIDTGLAHTVDLHIVSAVDLSSTGLTQWSTHAAAGYDNMTILSAAAATSVKRWRLFVDLNQARRASRLQFSPTVCHRESR